MKDIKKTSLSPASVAPADLPTPHQDNALDRLAQLTAITLKADIALVELDAGWGVWRSGAERASLKISSAASKAGVSPPMSAAALRQLSNPVEAEEGGFAFYACVPLKADQFNLGKVVILNRSARDAGTDEVALLRLVADVIVGAIQPQVGAIRQLQRT
jgi:GAF domain-containing protein